MIKCEYSRNGSYQGRLVKVCENTELCPYGHPRDLLEFGDKIHRICAINETTDERMDLISKKGLLSGIEDNFEKGISGF